MSVKVAKNRFINFSLVAKYRHFLESASNFVELGKRLTAAAETAQSMRQTEAVREYALILSNIPVKEYQLIGQYYLGWYACCTGGDVPTSLFENIFDHSKTYKSKSLITLGALAGARGDFEGEMRYLKEAIRHSDFANSIRIVRGVAMVKAKEGFHKSAVRSLESVLPVLRFARPEVYYNTLNSLAVEYGEIGRIEEAQNVCKIVLASPFTFAYPEWRETEQDLAIRGYKSRSSVPIIRKIPVVRKVRENVLYMSERERSEGHRLSPFYQPRDVSTIADWKEKKMGKEPNGNGEEKEELSDKQMVMKIMEYATDDDMPDEALHEMLEAIKKISRSYKSKKGKT
jgi:tetratricopeptide (TPR) repeat protein